jgi:steroid delta-isomerase-like uncharacterized protein
MAAGLTDEELRQSLDDYVAAWNARDIDRIVALFAENGRYGEFGEGRVLNGRDQIAVYFRTLISTVPDLRVNISACPFCAADRVFFKWTMRGNVSGGFSTRLAKSAPFELQGATVLVFEEGKICRAADSFEVRASMDLPGWPASSADERRSLPCWQASEDQPEDNVCFGE